MPILEAEAVIRTNETAAAVARAIARGDMIRMTPAELELAIARGAAPTLEELAKDRALIRALNSGDAFHAE
jgi:hypothetical protein